MTNPIVDPMVGRTIAHYEILARRGGGGMGVVYEARDTKLGRRVALKFLPPQWSHDEAAKQRFVREAQAASATDHPNVCTIHDVATTEDGQLFIVMAYYEGETLKQRLAGGALPLHEALDIATQVADGLAKAHANGVVHRDIKPGNVILTDDGVRIVDFGLATFADALQLTVPGSTLGTAAYMSPEQARGEDADARADVWAVGVILYEMLAGRVPFRGAYAEAIAYAIRNDAPAPLRADRPEVPEEVEQLVFRALHKDPTIRYQNGRDLARALRQARGFTMPMDLRTQAVDVGAAVQQPLRRQHSRLRLWMTAAAAAVLAVLVAGWWLSRPVERIPLVVAPVANETGDPEIEPYRLALTHLVITDLIESPNVRVLPYSRVLQVLRGFLERPTDVSSVEIVRALAEHSDARIVIVPKLMYANGEWWGRAELQDSATMVSAADAIETERAPSVLAKETATRLMASLARGIQEYFRENGPGQPFSVRPVSARLRTLDAAKAFEEGLSAYEAFEFAAARAAFRRAGDQDGTNPLPHAWLARAALMMRLTDEASAAAETAARLVIPDRTPLVDRLLVDASVAEARQDYDTAEQRYRELLVRFPDEPAWLLELAAFEDRRARTEEAVTTYHEALALDGRQVRPHLELCRLYNSTRMNNPPRATEHGIRALETYRRLGATGDEAQALLCLSDILRVGDPEEQREARRYAEAAVRIAERLGQRYTAARAYNYLAVIAGSSGNRTEAAEWLERALKAARDVENPVLEGGVLTNLGVTYEALRDYPRAIDYYRESYELNEVLGNERGAAYSRANTGAVLIQSGADPGEGLREVERALGVVQSLGDRNFEVFCRQILALHHRYAGRLDDAERELRTALSIAGQYGIAGQMDDLNDDLARLQAERGEYADAARGFRAVLEKAAAARPAETRILLGRTLLWMGDAAGAQQELARAAREAESALLHLALGELAYESGDLETARTHFERAAVASEDGLPDPANVEAAAYLGLLDALQGRGTQGVRSLASSLELGQKMGRFSMEVRSRVFLARIAVEAGLFDEALQWLSGASTADGRSVRPDLQAETHYWRSRALRGRGQTEPSRREESAARSLIQELTASIPEDYRGGFAARQSIREMIE